MILASTLKKPENEEQMKHNASRRKEIIKVRVQISEPESTQTPD